VPQPGSRSDGTSAPILIVEDDRNIAALVQTYLEAAGFETAVAHDGQDGLALARKQAPLLVVLDLMLPSIDGWEVCREIRKLSDVPILMLTAREEETDRIVGFSLGADDYVVKPFSPRELVERVKAILRRTAVAAPDPLGSDPGDALRRGGLVLDHDRHKVTCDGEEVPLTPTEFKLLQALMQRPGKVFSRNELLGRLYPHGEAVINRVIDVHIGKLRHKIESDPSDPHYIVTVHGVGYRFAELDES